MDAIGSNRQVWENLYTQKKSIMQYPNENFVRMCYYLLDDNDKNAVCWGFGSGNNLLQLLRMGRTVSGVEVSPEAIAITRKRVVDEGYGDIELHRTTDNTTPFTDSTFDLATAWQCICYNTQADMMTALREIYRVLKPGGKYLTTLYKRNDSIVSYCDKIGDRDWKVSDRFPSQAGAVLYIPENDDEIREVFSGFSEVNIGYYEYRLSGDYVGSHAVIFGRK